MDMTAWTYSIYKDLQSKSEVSAYSLSALTKIHNYKQFVNSFLINKKNFM